MADASIETFMENWLPPLEHEMRTVLAIDDPALSAHYGMLLYHMGWADADFQPSQFPAGKRLRPMLCLLACLEVGGDPAQALPAAAAIELLHNFSLIHDDIEDGDETRRHRPTVWKLWGVPQGINSGDAMFALAYAAMQRLSACSVDAEVILAVLHTFTQTCIALTEGQHLDLAFETRDQVGVEEYMRMIQGKTAALIGASIAIGARIGGAGDRQDELLQNFGREIGLAFQIQDDILGIWGDSGTTGKAAGNDILRRKKSLPLLYALNHTGIGIRLRRFWDSDLSAAQLPEVLDLLAEAQTREYATLMLEDHHQAAIDALHAALGDGAERSPLLALADGLLHRHS